MAGAGAEIMDKRGTEKEREPKINNFGSATLQLFIALPTTYESTLLIFRSRSWIYKKNRFRLDNPIQEYEHLNGGHADLTESQQYRHQQPTTPVPNGQQQKLTWQASHPSARRRSSDTWEQRGASSGTGRPACRQACGPPSACWTWCCRTTDGDR